MIVVITGDQYGRSIVCGDRGLASTSDLSISMTTLYIGERNTGGNEFDGYIYKFYHIPKRIYDNAARLLANPNHDLTTTADLIADSSLTTIEGNKYHTFNSIETSTRLTDNIQIGLEAGSSFFGDPLNVASVTGAKLITTGTGTAPTVMDEWINYYNNGRTHQGKRCNGRTPIQTFNDGKQAAKEKYLN